ncbi:hypothetical protein ACTM8Z_01390 [Atopobiaceae bacterium HCP3S3_D6]
MARAVLGIVGVLLVLAALVAASSGVAGAATQAEAGTVAPSSPGPLHDLPAESGWGSVAVHDRTGVEYILVTDGTTLAITPRFRPDGRPVVVPQE